MTADGGQQNTTHSIDITLPAPLLISLPLSANQQQRTQTQHTHSTPHIKTKVGRLNFDINRKRKKNVRIIVFLLFYCGFLNEYHDFLQQVNSVARKNKNWQEGKIL